VVPAGLAVLRIEISDLSPSGLVAGKKGAAREAKLPILLERFLDTKDNGGGWTIENYL
jgi:hypothetical protein